MSSAAQNQAVTGLVIIKGRKGLAGRQRGRIGQGRELYGCLGRSGGLGPWQSRPRSTFSPITGNLGFAPLGEKKKSIL